MSTKFFTNTDENTLFNKLQGVFQYNRHIQQFDALVAYFRASGYFSIRQFLEQIPKIRILVGIDVDRLVRRAADEGLDFFSNHERTKEEFMRAVQEDIASARYDRDTELGILQFINDIIERKIEVRAHREKNIHAKVYIFRPDNFNEHTPSKVITGSSNLTDAGLGAGNPRNYEFNVELNDYEDVKFATDEFEKLWAESELILPVDIQNIKKQNHLNDEVTPFEIYIKMLIEFFGDNIEYDPNSIGDLPPNFKKLSYQIDAVNEGYGMLLKHNGFVLADVVGLGKTVIATMVARRFILENGSEKSRILVVYPPAVEKNWKNTFKNFKIDHCAKFISNGNLNKILDKHPDYWNREDYDLIIVDEAHKFRNHKTGAFQSLQLICKSGRANKGRIPGSQKKVILVSATPLNNKPDDIFYQIQMFQDARQSTLPITNLTAFFGPLNDQYKSLKRYDSLDVDKLREIYGKIRKNVIAPITIRRTRTDLEKRDKYKKDLEQQGIKFPKVHPPQKVEYVMDESLNQLFHKTVFYLTDEDKLRYARYQAIAGLRPEIQERYYENAETVSKSLAMIMKNQLVKRLESSFEAFKITLSRFSAATEKMIEMIENNKVFIAPDTNINKLFEKGWSDDEIESEIEKLSAENPKNQTFKASDFQNDFIEALKKDARLLKELVKGWKAINHDPKLDVFLNELNKSFLSNKRNVEGKLVIFSESKETVNYLERAMRANGRNDLLVISADNRKAMYDSIVANFDANCEEDKKRNDYNIIITTEVLAEGVNLHRSNVIVHYDTPWNSTRLMQRIGRVNRIGTKAEDIYNYVFYPSAQGDSQIKLNKTAFMKIQAFHTAFGEDNQVYSKDEILDDVTLFSKKAVDGEEDIRLKYLHNLRDFRLANRAWFDSIKKLPLKSRTGRDANELDKIKLQNGTAVFLKTEQKLEFYWVDKYDQPSEISPEEAFGIFEAKQEELPVQLIETHQHQVSLAQKHFESIERTIASNQTSPEALGPVAMRAKKYIAELMKHPLPSENQKSAMKKIVYLIDQGKYTNLPSDVDGIQKKKPSIAEALVKLNSLALQYSVDDFGTEIVKKSHATVSTIIISESFK
jgi:ERCC4-related helicase